MSKVTLVVWRDAKTDPPPHFGLFRTDVGLLHYYDEAWAERASDGFMLPADPQPSVWCNPRPPGDDALTLDDLRNVLEFAHRGGMDTSYILAAQEAWHRLRRALEEAEGT